MSAALTALLVRWSERDERYVSWRGGRPRPLSPGEIATVRAVRRGEAMALVGAERSLALARAAAWDGGKE